MTQHDLMLALLKQANASAKMFLALRWDNLSDDEFDTAFGVGIELLNAGQATADYLAARREQSNA